MPALRKIALIAALGIIAALAVFWILTLPAVVPAAALAPYSANVANGKTMFDIGGCASCHAVPNKVPEKVDRTRLGGGLALKSPFGTFYAPNISPDPKDGIGELERSEFRHRAVEGDLGARHQPLSGVSLHVVPAHAARRCARPVCLFENPAAGRRAGRAITSWRFLSTIARLLGGWKLLFLHGGPFVPDPAQSAQWNRGAYLVNGPGHCAECHSAAQCAWRHYREPTLCRRPCGWTAMVGCRTSRRPGCGRATMSGRRRISRASSVTA